MSEKRQRTGVVSFRVTPAEKLMLEVVSELREESLSDFVRDCAMGVAKELLVGPDRGEDGPDTVPCVP